MHHAADTPVDRSERSEATLLRLALLLRRSPMQRDIVRLLVAGRSRKQIAAILDRSPHTIDGHLKDLYRFVGVGDRARLMLLASRLQATREPAPRDPSPPDFGGGVQSSSATHTAGAGSLSAIL